MSFNTGTAQVDAALYKALKAYGVLDHEAREIARMDAFGGQNAVTFLAGLEAVAILIINPVATVMAHHPWSAAAHEITASVSAGQTSAAALMQAATEAMHADPAVQDALTGALGAAMTKLGMSSVQPTAPPPLSGGATTAHQAAQIQQAALMMTPPDPGLIQRVQAELASGKGTAAQRRKRVSEMVGDWLAAHGRFVKTIYDRLYYLWRSPDGGRLYALDSTRWKAFLYLLTDCSTVSTEFKVIQAHCDAVCIMHGEQVPVVRVAYWDQDTGTLRVSRFDGQVYRLDGFTIEQEANGDGPALFEDQPSWIPFEPAFGTDGSVLDWTIREIPQWDGDPARLTALFRAWVLGVFFTELCPTRPIFVVKGEKGSGKSMSIRVMLKMLFGPGVDLSGVPAKPDDFMALASNSHIVAIDNLDDPNKDLRNGLASMATGKVDVVRKLYTNNEQMLIEYRSWIAITSRTPDTLQRDDIIDRLVLVPVKRIEDADRTREAKFIQAAVARRSQWWGDVLDLLNQIVASINEHGLPDRAGLRMEDWASLGEVISRVCGDDAVWSDAIDDLKKRRDQFAVEGESIVEALDAWLAQPGAGPGNTYSNGWFTTRQLYTLLQAAAFPMGEHPDASWPRSVKSFGRRLAGIQRELQARLAEQKPRVDMAWRLYQGNTQYQFQK